MEHFYQLGWTLDPVGGASGEAYKAEQDGRKLFLKRNASPFLAVRVVDMMISGSHSRITNP